MVSLDGYQPCFVIMPDGNRVPAKCKWNENIQAYDVFVWSKDVGLDTPSIPYIVLTLKTKYVEINK